MSDEIRFLYEPSPDPSRRRWQTSDPLWGFKTAQTRGPGGIFEQLVGRRRSDKDLLAGLKQDLLNTLLRNRGKVVLWGTATGGTEHQFYELTVELAHSARTRSTVKGRICDVTRQQMDGLTGLFRPPNGEILDLETDEWIAAHRGRVVGLAIADADNFSEVNGKLGHDAGDQVLSETGKRLRKAASREIRPLRWYAGGDEFLVLLAADTPGEFWELVKQLQGVLEFSTLAGGAQLGVTYTVHGFIAEAGESPKELRVRTDLAMSEAKQARKAAARQARESRDGSVDSAVEVTLS